MALLRVLLTLPCLLILVTPSPASAETVGEEESQINVLVEAIGRPAHEKPVSAALSSSRLDGLIASKRLATALGRCGGAHAAYGLARLAARSDPAVARLALQNATALGLRHEGLARAAVRLLEGKDGESRRLALHALARLGDGRHVPAVLRTAASSEPATRAVAFLALRMLSGLKLPDRVDRWSVWWRQASKRAARDVSLAIQRLEASGDRTLDGVWRDVLRRSAWLDLRATRLQARRWLQADDVRLRQEAARLIEAGRLADLAGRLGSAYRPSNAATDDPMLQALLALGFQTTSVRLGLRLAEGRSSRVTTMKLK